MMRLDLIYRDCQTYKTDENDCRTMIQIMLFIKIKMNAGI
jgi:hypothetical protein